MVDKNGIYSKAGALFIARSMRNAGNRRILVCPVFLRSVEVVPFASIAQETALIIAVIREALVTIL